MSTLTLPRRPVALPYGASVGGRGRLGEFFTVLACVALVLATGWVTIRPVLPNVGSTHGSSPQ